MLVVDEGHAYLQQLREDVPYKAKLADVALNQFLVDIQVFLPAPCKLLAWSRACNGATYRRFFNEWHRHIVHRGWRRGGE